MFRSIGTGFAAAALAFLRVLPDLLREGAGLAAVGSIAYGAWLLHPAAGFIVGGSLVLTGVLLSSRTTSALSGSQT
ncbi:hypothetical protein [Hyphomicrobium sp. ghe19]|uniref:hypothetical protein n=1 Tax=Hyphomicrobium sp. ghe19 TaxID=2682968 RepID=UPI0013677AE2|nr:hypothetical protein HYPP_03779 [Hyphomicrobium sp. ghe19]